MRTLTHQMALLNKFEDFLVKTGKLQENTVVNLRKPASRLPARPLRMRENSRRT